MKKRFVEIAVKVVVAALTAFLTAITTTSCMGMGPSWDGYAARAGNGVYDRADDANGDCGTVTVGGVVKAQSDFTGATYTYRP